ncbi:MAG: alpha/beta hydrolase [Brevundimonas sp.]|nr:MAG: alpha/beta hydrolase [Brevundimonas sp.]
MRRLAIPLGLVLLVYLLVVGVFFFLQRDMLYQPGAFSGAPLADGPPIQVVGIDTPDGERLVGWYLPPKPGMPTLLFFNGQGGGLEFQGGRWSRIADEGVGFLSIGYRGHDGSTGDPSEAGLHTDARAAYDWLVQRTRPGDIVIHGYSLGTGVAVKLATERAARALVLEAPYTSTADIAARSYPWLPVRWLMLDQYRSRDIIDRVRCPILIVHGTGDMVIPVAQGRTLYDLARAPKRFVRMIGSNHATLTRDGLYDHVWRFLGLPPADTADEGRRAEVIVTET